MLWLPNSPDLNLVNFYEWSIVEQWLYRTHIRDISRLKVWLVEEWKSLIVDWEVICQVVACTSEVICRRRRRIVRTLSIGYRQTVTTLYFQSHILNDNKINVVGCFCKMMCQFLLACFRVRISKISDKLRRLCWIITMYAGVGQFYLDTDYT